MFISKLIEAWIYDFCDIIQDYINQSNNLFSAIVSEHINESFDGFLKNIKEEYGALAKNNLIDEFKLERLFVKAEKTKFSLQI